MLREEENGLNITVCIGSSCHLKGSREVAERLQEQIAQRNLKEQIDLCGAFCMGRCKSGVSVTIDSEPFSVTPESTERFFLDEVLPRIACDKIG